MLHKRRPAKLLTPVATTGVKLRKLANVRPSQGSPGLIVSAKLLIGRVNGNTLVVRVGTLQSDVSNLGLFFVPMVFCKQQGQMHDAMKPPSDSVNQGFASLIHWEIKLLSCLHIVYRRKIKLRHVHKTPHLAWVMPRVSGPNHHDPLQLDRSSKTDLEQQIWIRIAHGTRLVCQTMNVWLQDLCTSCRLLSIKTFASLHLLVQIPIVFRIGFQMGMLSAAMLPSTMRWHGNN
mmetsp:Transcript_21562/g.47418  ORF Transcript_21562/g.47418 Transcript_21562/m.47418 type:complete len:232 (-) Transcript_21562:10-705(-)